MSASETPAETIELMFFSLIDTRGFERTGIRELSEVYTALNNALGKERFAKCIREAYEEQASRDRARSADEPNL